METPRRSRRLEGVKLGSRIEQLNFDGRRQGLLDLRAEREAKHADKAVKLQFMDIIPELRIRIYGFVVVPEHPRILKIRRAPTLAMVSKQVRAEMLPVFFSQCTFSISAQSNVLDMPTLDNLHAKGILPNLETPFTEFPNLLCLQLLRRLDGCVKPVLQSHFTVSWLGKLQRQEGVTPRLRNVSIQVQALEMGWRSSYATLLLRVPVASASQPVVTVDSCEEVEHRAAFEQLRAHVATSAERVAGRHERFTGFTMADLEEVCEAFKYWPGVESEDLASREVFPG